LPDRPAAGKLAAMRIERFDPLTDDAQLRACYQMAVAGQPADDPNVPAAPLELFRSWWAFGFADHPAQSWLGTDRNGEPVGGYTMELPVRENRDNAFGSVLVTPAARRRGFGTALLAHLASQAALAGRTRLLSAARVGSPGEGFAATTGGTKGMLDVRRLLRVDAGARRLAAELQAEAEPHAAGYELRCWEGPTPADLADGVCATHTALEDAPHDSTFEPPGWDPERLAAVEQRLAGTGLRRYSVAAIAAGTGEVAALTEVDVHPAQPGWAEQALTAVTRAHRGHRLGLLVKAAMLGLLAGREPAVETIATYNADSNGHMVAINDRLGYRVSDYFRSWEHGIEATSRLAGSQS
jgi:GNAT superfamily N-acetyltransferase